MEFFILWNWLIFIKSSSNGTIIIMLAFGKYLIRNSSCVEPPKHISNSKIYFHFFLKKQKQLFKENSGQLYFTIFHTDQNVKVLIFMNT